VVVTVLVFCDWTLTLKFGLLVEWASCFVVEVARAYACQLRSATELKRRRTDLLLVELSAIRIVLVVHSEVLEASL
jgi:hypothetical protein